MFTRTTFLAGVVGGVVCLAGCFPAHQSVRRESFVQVEAGQRDALFSRAVQVLLSRGWVMAAVNGDAGVLATQPKETYLKSWDLYQVDTVQVSFRTGGKLAVSLQRQLRPASVNVNVSVHSSGGVGHSSTAYTSHRSGPDPSRVTASAAVEQNAILAEITSTTDVSVLRHCEQVASAYGSALPFARTCGELGAHVCTGVRPMIDEGSKMLSSGKVSVVPSRSAELDRILAEYRQAGCVFTAAAAAAAADPGDECLGALASPTCQ